MLKIRAYQPGDEQRLWEIYFSAVREVCSKDYTREQVCAWAPDDFPKDRWRDKMQSINPFVVMIDNIAVGYADLQEDGYIDHFFVASQYQRQGVGVTLMQAILHNAQQAGIERLYSHVSKTARGFFARHGFFVVKAQQVEIRACVLENYIMEYTAEVLEKNTR